MKRPVSIYSCPGEGSQGPDLGVGNGIEKQNLKRNVTNGGTTELEGVVESDGLRLCASWFGKVSMSLTAPE